MQLLGGERASDSNDSYGGKIGVETANKTKKSNKIYYAINITVLRKNEIKKVKLHTQYTQVKDGLDNPSTTAG